MSKTFSQSFNGRKYTCQRIPAMKQLKMMKYLSALSDMNEDDPDLSFFFEKINWEELAPLLVKESKLECDKLNGEEDNDGEVLPHIDSHFETLDELISVCAWILGKTLAK